MESMTDATAPDTTVLVAAADQPYAPTVCQALRASESIDVRLVGTAESSGDLDADVDTFSPTVSADHEDFVSELVDVGHDESVDAVFPLGRPARRAVARARPIFQDLRMTPVVAPLDGVLTAADAQECLDALTHRQLAPVPDFARVTGADELLGGARALGYPDRSVVVRLSGGRRIALDPDGVDRTTIRNAADASIDDPPGEPLTLQAAATLVRTAEDSPRIQVTEALPGPRHAVDAVVRDGDLLAAVPQTVSRTTEGNVVRHTEPNESLVETTAAIADELDLEYNVVARFGTDPDGTRRLVGVVPGLDASVRLSVEAGVNTPAVALAAATGHDQTAPDPMTPITLRVDERRDPRPLATRH